MMTSPLDKVKNFFGLKNVANFGVDDPLTEPQIGFKVLYYAERKSIGVKVIAARNLPTSFGSVKPKGYLVKVKLFPGKDKFETQVVSSSCPCFDEHFMFPAGITNMGQFAGRFVTFTVYADLEGPNSSTKTGNPLVRKRTFREQIESAFVKSDDVPLRPKTNRTQTRTIDRFSLNNRRTIGAVTFNLDRNSFTEMGKGGARYTPDIWRTIKDINSGRELESRESKKGSLEITMKYSNSEDGKNDMIQISLSKFRCSMATMQEHEKQGGNLYLKMATHEYDVVVSKWKGDTFTPTISMRIEPQSATMITTICAHNLDKTKVVLKLKSRNVLQQKSLMGTIVIDKNTSMFQAIVQNPTMAVTKMLDFQ